MKVTPLYDRILIRVYDERRSAGGLVIPEIAHQNTPMGRGVVIAVGHGMPVAGATELRPLTVRAGDAVWYSRPAAQPIPYEGPPGSVVMVREPDILAVLTDLPRDTGLEDAAGNPILAAVQ